MEIQIGSTTTVERARYKLSPKDCSRCLKQEEVKALYFGASALPCLGPGRYVGGRCSNRSLTEKASTWLGIGGLADTNLV